MSSLIEIIDSLNIILETAKKQDLLDEEGDLPVAVYSGHDLVKLDCIQLFSFDDLGNCVIITPEDVNQINSPTGVIK